MEKIQWNLINKNQNELEQLKDEKCYIRCTYYIHWLITIITHVYSYANDLVILVYVCTYSVHSLRYIWSQPANALARNKRNLRRSCFNIQQKIIHLPRKSMKQTLFRIFKYINRKAHNTT